MTRTSIAVAAAFLSTAALMPTLAQAQFSEPAAYQAAHPDRDVLNMEEYFKAWKSHHGESSVSLITARGCPFHCEWSRGQ